MADRIAEASGSSRPPRGRGVESLRLLVLAMTVLGPSAVQAETHIHDSVEWLCARAEIVSFGRLVAVDPVVPSQAHGKSRHLVSLELRPTTVVKGRAPAAAAAPLHFSVRVPDTARLVKWKAAGTELVVFLDRTIQAYSKGGRNYDLWPLRETGSQVQLLVDPAQPHAALLLAEGMKRATTPAHVVAACARAAAVASSTPAPVPGARAPSHLLEVPPGTEAFEVLHQGSSCELRVPPGAFPKARPKL